MAKKCILVTLTIAMLEFIYMSIASKGDLKVSDFPLIIGAVSCAAAARVIQVYY